MSDQQINRLTLEEAFSTTLTYVPCVSIDKRRDVWVATLMCAQYLESAVDSIVVRNDDFKPIGIVGGYDLLDHMRKNPTVDSQYKTNVEQVMFRDLPKIEKKTTLKDLINFWKKTGRAFAIVPNEYGDYSLVSARRMLEVGTRCKTDITVSAMGKKKIVTFRGDETLVQILDLMYENKTRRILLQNTDQYISDRSILAGMTKMLNNLETGIDNFLDIPVNRFDRDEAKTIKDDLRFDRLCEIMNRMERPYIKYNDTVITPWDVCLTLLSGELTAPLREIEVSTSWPQYGDDAYDIFRERYAKGEVTREQFEQMMHDLGGADASRKSSQ